MQRNASVSSTNSYDYLNDKDDEFVLMRSDPYIKVKTGKCNKVAVEEDITNSPTMIAMRESWMYDNSIQRITEVDEREEYQSMSS